MTTNRSSVSKTVSPLISCPPFSKEADIAKFKLKVIMQRDWDLGSESALAIRGRVIDLLAENLVCTGSEIKDNCGFTMRTAVVTLNWLVDNGVLVYDTWTENGGSMNHTRFYSLKDCPVDMAAIDHLRRNSIRPIRVRGNGDGVSNATLQRVLESLSETGICTAGYLSDILGLSLETVRIYLSFLAKKGAINRHSKDAYSLRSNGPNCSNCFLLAKRNLEQQNEISGLEDRISALHRKFRIMEGALGESAISNSFRARMEELLNPSDGGKPPVKTALPVDA